ncbi:hypothetical protein HYZ06_01130 [Candidatus Daviesbacteria bacterium]|nr:hypothetical protein [Candidatus Daviesbacteria bacterium]
MKNKFSQRMFYWSKKMLIGCQNLILGSWNKELQLKKDYLDRELHAQNVADEIIKNLGVLEDSYIFAISGKWGEGKTDLLERIEPKLLQNCIPVIWFRPWQYTENAETLRRTFLNNLNSFLNSYRNILRRVKFYFSNLGFLDRLKFDESRTSINKHMAVLFILIVLDILLFLAVYKIFTTGEINIFQFFKHIAEQIIKFISGHPILAAILSLFGVLSLLPEFIKIQRSQIKVTSVDEFEELFDKILNDFKKVVVFVDDLDRCTPEGVKIVLDSLKTFFRNPKVSYVVTGDHTVIERYLGKQLNVRLVYKDESGEIDKEKTEIEEELEGRRFLKKLFNVYWRVPPTDRIYMKTLVEKNLERLEELEDNQKSQIQTLMISFLDRNPREVDRFTELLLFSLKTIKSRLESLSQEENNSNLKKNLEEVKEHPDLLVKVLLIQEKFDSAFREYSLQPARYAILEREQLRNSPGEESNLMNKKLGSNAPLFFELVKTKPTFHNDRFSLDYSPDNFFYYSGFAGASDRGVLSEDFLDRYITADPNLVKDIQGTSKALIEEILPSGISNLNQLNDPAQLGQAVTNLVAIFLSDTPSSWSFVAGFLDNQKTKDYYNSLSDDQQKDSFITNLWNIVLRSKLVTISKKIITEDPWKSKKEVVWNIVDITQVGDGVLGEFVDDLIADQNNGVDISQKKQKVLDDFWKIINNSNSNSIEEIRVAINKINELAVKLDIKKLASAALFGGVIESIKGVDEKPKKEELLKFLTKQTAFWSEIPKPSNELRALNPTSTLRKSDLGNRVKEIYETWYPPRLEKRKRRRKK